LLDFHLAIGIWYLLKDLSRSIHEAVDPFDTLPTYLNPNRLNKISMAPLRILMIEGFSQNMLLSTTTWEEVHKLFKMAQSVGLEALEWIGEVKRCCKLVGGRHGWHWDNPEAGAVTIHTHLPLLEGQGQIEYRLYSMLTSDSPTNNISPSKASKPSFFIHIFLIGLPTIPNTTPSLHWTQFLVLLFTSRRPHHLRSC
jgi:hypothetical protein